MEANEPGRRGRSKPGAVARMRTLWRLGTRVLICVVSGLVAMPNAFAETKPVICSPVAGLPATVTLPNSLGLSPNTPINTVVWRQSFTISGECGKDSGGTYPQTPRVGFLLVGHTSSTAGGGAQKLQLWNGSGLELFVTINGNQYSNATDYALDLGVDVPNIYGSKNVTFSAQVDIELVKTGEMTVGPNNLTSSAIPVLFLATIMPNYGAPYPVTVVSNFLKINGLNSIKLLPQTCEAASPNTTVDLGKVTLGENGFGNSVNSTSVGRSFTIDMNCYTNGTPASYKLALTLDPAGLSVPGQNGVLALDGTSTASGAGIQILDGAGINPVTFGNLQMVGQFGVDIRPPTSFSVPLYARFIQTGQTVSPGRARAQAAFTISYP
ncbi:fimbrial family protein [Paraburkholderia xenovorans LB400]|uniref:Fimbrial protein n=1 Tax=Paraburkholderia xenovorans (strain LB400) TaxID=266265 RepID=Q13FX4_PARXL|nr:fimbrial protein [Paraburkholderia xenovorans]ABE37015.1 Putative fimbrial protein [Paraburkholderia xenovorans LB400]AIP34730.1 fimbrial family protein [Paraburkholderia xenovorans LB400]